MWIFKKSTGEFSHDGDHVTTGYSGFGEGKNNPAMESVANVGPIPRGDYSIGPPYDSETHGPVVMRATPKAGTNTYGRSGFLIHGESMHAPGMASRGCIILGRLTRLSTAASDDNDLEVVA